VRKIIRPVGTAAEGRCILAALEARSESEGLNGGGLCLRREGDRLLSFPKGNRR